MVNNDRTLIIPLLKEHFPTLVGMTSDEVRGFLNAQTGLDIGHYEPNSSAFDRWRQALRHLGVWGLTQEQKDAIKLRGEALKAEHDQLRAKIETGEQAKDAARAMKVKDAD